MFEILHGVPERRDDFLNYIVKRLVLSTNQAEEDMELHVISSVKRIHAVNEGNEQSVVMMVEQQ